MQDSYGFYAPAEEKLKRLFIYQPAWLLDSHLSIGCFSLRIHLNLVRK